MAIKKVQMIPPGYTDVVHPETAADNIIETDSKKVMTGDERTKLGSIPSDAVFTDTNTVTSINGKTGVIAKADIVALGIPAQDTVYAHPASHPASMITDLPTGKKVARFTIGTSTSGWTTSDCDYLCDGTADQFEINQAIQALPAGGGKIILLDGVFEITGDILVNKPNVEICGSVSSKLLFRNSSYTRQMDISEDNCTVQNLTIEGEYTSSGVNKRYPIVASGVSNLRIQNIVGTKCNIYIHECSYSIIINNIVGKNNSYLEGFRLEGGKFNLVAQNNLTGAYYGVYAGEEEYLVITANFSSTFNEGGVYTNACNNVTISDNIFRTEAGGLVDGIKCVDTFKVNITGNHIDMLQPGINNYGIIIYGEEHFSITNNVIRNISDNKSCIELNRGSEFYIAGNRLFSDGESHIKEGSTVTAVTKENNFIYPFTEIIEGGE